MKRLVLFITSLVLTTVSSQAMSFEQAREQALFLADKMAYEMNLTEEQYEACYEINLDYLMSIASEDEIFGDYWTQRNLDLSYILLDWQYRYFLEAVYFYRPIYWADGLWHFSVYARYPYRNYFYFGRPRFWDTYHGGHSWRNNGGKSWYNSRPNNNKGTGVTNRQTNNSTGMRDKFNKGDYGRGQNIDPKDQNGRIGNNGQSSTRLTVGNTGPSTSSANKPTTSTRNVGSTTNSTAKSQSTTSAKNPTSTFNNSTTKQTSTKSSGTPRLATGSTTKSTSTAKPATSTAKSTTSSSSTKSSTPTRSTTSASKSTGSTSSVKSSTPTRSTTSTAKSSSSTVSKSSSSASRSSSSSVSRGSSSSPSRSAGGARSGGSGGSRGGGRR